MCVDEIAIKREEHYIQIIHKFLSFKFILKYNLRSDQFRMHIGIRKLKGFHIFIKFVLCILFLTILVTAQSDIDACQSSSSLMNQSSNTSTMPSLYSTATQMLATAPALKRKYKLKTFRVSKSTDNVCMVSFYFLVLNSCLVHISQTDLYFYPSTFYIHFSGLGSQVFCSRWSGRSMCRSHRTPV